MVLFSKKPEKTTFLPERRLTKNPGCYDSRK